MSTTMERLLQVWITPGLTCYTLAVGLFGLRLHLDRLASTAIVVGSALILVGFTEALCRWLVWRFWKYGRLDRAVKKQIKLGEALLRQSVVIRNESAHWDNMTQQVLRRYLGDNSHPELLAFESCVDPSVAEDYKTIVAQKIHQLMMLRQKAKNREVPVIPNRAVRLSRP